MVVLPGISIDNVYPVSVCVSPSGSNEGDCPGSADTEKQPEIFL